MYALVRQEYKPLLKVIEEYKGGRTMADIKEDEDFVKSLRSHGTRIEAALSFLEENYVQKLKKPTIRKKKSVADD